MRRCREQLDAVPELLIGCPPPACHKRCLLRGRMRSRGTERTVRSWLSLPRTASMITFGLHRMRHVSFQAARAGSSVCTVQVRQAMCAKYRQPLVIGAWKRRREASAS